MKDPIISIIIPTPSSNYELLQKCVNTFVKYKSFSVEYDFCIVPNEWTGFEPNVNKALKMSIGDYILFTNDDVWIKKKGWDIEMIKAFEKEGVGMVSGTGYAWNDLPAFWFVMISRKVLDDVGILDESFTLYSSDFDYGMRVKQAGYKIAHLKLMPFVGHIFCASSKRVTNENKIMKAMREKFGKKWNIDNTKFETMYLDIDKQILDIQIKPGKEHFTIC